MSDRARSRAEKAETFAALLLGDVMRLGMRAIAIHPGAHRGRHRRSGAAPNGK